MCGMTKPLIGLLVFLLIGGLISYFAPIEARWKNLIYAVSAIITVVVLLVWLLRVFGIWTGPLPF
jgi:hypothetical protein